MSVCTHVDPSSPLVGPETSQDRRAIKAYSECQACQGEAEEKPALLLCKPLFHFHTFHTSLSLSAMIFHRSFGSRSVVNTIQALRSWLSHLLPWVNLGTSSYTYHLLLIDLSKICVLYLFFLIISFVLGCSKDRVTTTVRPISLQLQHTACVCVAEEPCSLVCVRHNIKSVSMADAWLRAISNAWWDISREGMDGYIPPPPAQE